MKHDERAGFAFYLQILILLFVFLGVCAILVQAFAAARTMSLKARKTTDAVEICRNAAEVFSAQEDAENAILLLGGTPDAASSGTASVNYDDTYHPAENGAYTLMIAVSADAAGEGQMLAAKFSVCDTAGTVLAELETEKYLPAKGGASNEK